jgi:apolipoprotein D and lipocalin family protein|tara:strand:- start:1017 stop:1529 length:513 start_codon:yes stop_codon:yes gene_type:complete
MKTLLILFLIFAGFLKGADTMKTVEFVDLEKFMGKWFVIALVPNMIEKGATNSSDTYVLNNDGTIDITYDAIKDGKERQIKQKGTVIDKSSNAEWTIQMRKPFVPFMKFPFKIVYVNENYEYMAVGYPKNTMGWIMGRSSQISNEDFDKIMSALIELGYTKDQFEFVEHN